MSADPTPLRFVPAGKTVHTLKRTERMSLQADFKTVFTRGVRIRAAHFDIRYLRNENVVASRLGLSVSRGVGMAVMRNRLKRMTREWFRMNKQRLQPCADLVFCLRNAFGKTEVKHYLEKIEEMLKPILIP